MTTTDSFRGDIKKRIIITIFAIIATVTSAVLISIILPDKKDKKAPKLPGLTHFDSVYGVYSFDYPTFFEKIKEHRSTKSFTANVGTDFQAYDIFEKTAMVLKGKGFMLIFIMPISDESKSITAGVLSQVDSYKDWLTVVDTISTQRGKSGEDFIYIERRIRTRIIGTKEYDIVRIQTSDGFYVIAWAYINNKDWKNYKKEIRDSFKSIEFFPSVARELLEKLPDP